MKVVELLNAPEKWCKYSSAKDGRNRVVDPCAESATCFCLIGALMRCYPEDHKAARKEICKAIAAVSPHWSNFQPRQISVVDFNDAELTDFPLLQKVLQLANV